MILAIDPGCSLSAYVLMDKATYEPVEFGKIPNDEMLRKIRQCNQALEAGRSYGLAVEMVASYGMAVGVEIFETVFWIGRFWETARCPEKCKIYRMGEKMNLCHNARARDSNIRQALIDRFARHDLKNGKGTKSDPDFFYGFSRDVWAAYAVGVTYLDRRQKE